MGQKRVSTLVSGGNRGLALGSKTTTLKREWRDVIGMSFLRMSKQWHKSSSSRRNFVRVSLLLGLSVFLFLWGVHIRGRLPGKVIVPVSVSPSSLQIDRFDQINLEEAVQNAWKDRGIVPSSTGTTLVASCRNRLENLQTSLGSWLEVRGIDELILLDWGSRDLHRFATIAHPAVDPRILAVAAVNTSSWTLTRAYNLAVKFASGKNILKVDCDTVLDARFLERNTLTSSDEYLTASWREARSENEQRLRGVFLVERKHFLSVAGFDERLTEYGHEELDLFARFKSRLGLHEKELDLRTIYHLHHSGKSFVNLTSHHLIPKLSARVNTLSLQKLEKWPATASHIQPSSYSIHSRKDSFLIMAKQIQSPSDISELIRPTDRLNIVNAAEQTLLHDEFGLPWDVISELSDFDFDLMLEVMYSDREKIMMVDVRGNLPDRFSSLVNAVAMAITLKRILVVAWGDDNSDGSDQVDIASIADLFDLQRTNQRLRDHTHKDIFIFSISKWSCKFNVADCIDVDNAYRNFEEITIREDTAYIHDPVDEHIVINNVELASEELISDAVRYQAIRTLLPSRTIEEYVQVNGDARAQVLLYVNLRADEKQSDFEDWVTVNAHNTSSDLFVTGYDYRSVTSIRNKLNIQTPTRSVDECKDTQWMSVDCLQHAIADLWTTLAIPTSLNEVTTSPYPLPRSLQVLRRSYQPQRELGGLHFVNKKPVPIN